MFPIKYAATGTEVCTFRPLPSGREPANLTALGRYSNIDYTTFPSLFQAVFTNVRYENAFLST